MPSMTAEMAMEIVAQGTKYSAFELSDVPATEAEKMGLAEIKQKIGESFDAAAIMEEAAKLVQLARNAYDKDMRSDAIGEIMFAALVEPTQEELDKYSDVFARHPDHGRTASSNGTSSAQAPAEPQASADGQVEIDKIVPGYDDHKVADLKKAILAAAASGDLTEGEWEQIKAYESANEERKSILGLEPTFQAPAPASAPTPVAQPPGEFKGSLVDSYNDGTIGMDRVRQESLPIPPQYTGEEPILPVDITAESHQEITRLSMRFDSLAARTLWLASQEAGRRDVADHLAREAYASFYARHYARLKDAIEKETASAIDNARSEAKHLADVEDDVRTWRSRAAYHAAEARSLEALASGYESKVARLSREQSRRQDLASTPS